MNASLHAFDTGRAGIENIRRGHFYVFKGSGSAVQGSMELEFRADEEERSRRVQDTNFGERKIEITRYSPRYFFNVDPCLN